MSKAKPMPIAERRSVPLIVRVQPDLAERVRAAAAVEHRTISTFGLVALEQAVDRVLAPDSRSDAEPKPKPTTRIVRQSVTRGGKRVEVNAGPVRETR